MPANDKIILNREAYPGTVTNKEKVDKPKAKKIASAKRIKKPFYKRFANAFLDGEPAREVGEYVIYDVIIPAAKSTLADLVEGAIDLLLFGGAGRISRNRSPYLSRDRGRTIVSTPYNSMHERSGGVPGSRGRYSRAHAEEHSRVRGNDVSDIVFLSRGEADAVLGELAETIARYGSASVSDFFDMAGISTPYTDQRWGWTDISGVGVARVREGWIIDLPRPIVID